MNKKIRVILIIGIISIVFLFSTGIYWFCEVPIESKLEIHTVWGQGKEAIEDLSNDLDGQITSIGDWSFLSHERYYLTVHASLKDILLSKRILKEPYVIRMYYEWEIEPWQED